MSRSIVVASVLIAAGLIAALLATSPPGAQLIHGSAKTVFVLFDLSGSTRSMRSTYASEFEKVLAKLGPGDRLIVDRITDRPLTESTFPVNETFPAYGLLDQRGNPIFQPVNQRELDDKRAAVRTTVTALLNSAQGSEATAILDSLQLAERVFTTYPDKRKVLVIFSDMVEIFGANNFVYDDLNDARINQVIAARENLGELPNLQGVEVYVAGAGAGRENWVIKSQRWFQIENFWLAYFAATHAELTKDRYGAALLEF